MIDGVSLKNPLFVNTVGHACGILLFGVLLALLIRDRKDSQDRPRRASISAALLALAWNVGALVGLSSAQRQGSIAGWLVALNFSLLTLLPPVLLKIVLRGKHRRLVAAGFALGCVSVILHFLELPFQSPGLHDAALLLIAAGFPCLLAMTLVLDRANRTRSLALPDAICLLLFTLSLLHFGYGHSNTAWFDEVAWHHAGIPLAAIVLLRDYRLLFVEAFVRFVANFALAALYGIAVYWAVRGGHLLEAARGNDFKLGLLLVLLCCSLVLFAYQRTNVQKQLTRRIFHRGELGARLNNILKISSESQSEKELLSRSAREVAVFVDADRTEILPDISGMRTEWAELQLQVRFSRGDTATVLLGRRSGGRRYLPEDIDAVTKLLALITEQVERFRANELQRLADQAELRALQAQVNPHFLFNALNTLYGIIGPRAPQARKFVLNLAELFRYFLQQPRTFISLGEELSIIEAYLEIESLRFGDRLVTKLSIDPDTREIPIPVLTIQPLVENAIKHGVARKPGKSEVNVTAKCRENVLQITVADTGPGFQQNSTASGLGLGIPSLRQRLTLCYGPSSSLEVDSTPSGTVVTIAIPLNKPSTFCSASIGSGGAGEERSSTLNVTV